MEMNPDQQHESNGGDYFHKCGCRRTSSAERLCPEHEVPDRTNSEEFAKQSAESLPELG